MDETRGAKPLRERLDIPDHVEVYMYAGQKLNFNEFQKEQLRKRIEKDTANFYTYSEDHLSLAFPVVNENEITVKEKAANEAKWTTKDGFSNVPKKTLEEWKTHGKKPPQSMIDDLAIPYIDQVQDKVTGMATKIPRSSIMADKAFNLNFIPPATFSHPKYFKTVHLGGDDVLKEMEEAKKAEHDAWKKKLVVDNAHFKVNTREVKKIQQLDKHKGLREDPVRKVGLRLKNS